MKNILINVIMIIINLSKDEHIFMFLKLQSKLFNYFIYLGHYYLNPLKSNKINRLLHEYFV
jgi:hypothetical protein